MSSTSPSLIIDSHAHVFPDRVRQYVPESAQAPIEEIRRRARSWLKPVAGSMHKAQTILRHLPKPARRALDELSGLAPLPTLLFESTVSDLTSAMEESGVHRTLVIAHPTLISNEFILEACEENPGLLGVVNIPAGLDDPGRWLKDYVERGAVAVKLHPAADGEGPDSDRYLAILEKADELGLPVILHTGCLHTHLLYKAPLHGRAELYTDWFATFPKTRFVLAHMNYHEPQIALDLMEEHPNLYTDTSWQPSEMIGEAVRRVGAERVLFGTDWPFVGNNLSIGLARVRDSVESGLITEAQARLILGENAAKLFKVSQ